MSTLLVVVNPAAGGGACGRRAPAVVARLRSAGLAVEVVETRSPGDAREIARRAAADGVREVVAAGGDGTCFEVVDGLLSAPPGSGPPRLGVLPLGSGNSFVRDFSEEGLEHAIATLAGRRWQRCDAIRLSHDRGVLHLVNLFSVGFVAEVGSLRNRRYARLGAPGYVLAVLAKVLGLRQLHLPLTVDGKLRLDEPATFVAVTNSRFTGGAMMMAPSARVDDGLLDLVWVGALGRLALLRTFPKLYAGTHIRHPAVRTHQGRRVDFELPGPLDVLVDGEILHLKPTRLEVLPAALEVGL